MSARQNQINLPKVEVTPKDDYITNVTITCPNCEPWKSVFQAMEEEQQQKEISA